MIEHLFKRKRVRDFLNLYSENKWTKLITMVLEYGIVQLSKNTNIASLTLEEIQSLINEITQETEKNMKKELQQRCENRNRSKSQGPKVRSRSKKPSKWRTGDDIQFIPKDEYKIKSNDDTSSLNSDIYPKWWGTKTKIDRSRLEEIAKNNNEVESNNILKVNDFENDTQNTRYAEEVQNREEAKENQNNNETSNKIKNDKTKAKKVKKENSNQTNKNKKIKTKINPPEHLKEVIINKDFNVESKIKDAVERDRKLYNQQKQQNAEKQDSERKEEEYSHPRIKRANTNTNYQTVTKTDYMIEYNKNLKPQAIKEKSIERLVPEEKYKENKRDQIKEHRKDNSYKDKKVNTSKIVNKNIFLEDAMVKKKNSESSVMFMSDTEGPLSVYSPNDDTKDFFRNELQNNFDQTVMDSSKLSNTITDESKNGMKNKN